MFVYTMILTIMTLMSGSTAAQVDNMGHLGGFISGFLVGMAIVPAYAPDRGSEKKHTIGWFSIVALFSLMLVFFYTVREPEKYTEE